LFTIAKSALIKRSLPFKRTTVYTIFRLKTNLLIISRDCILNRRGRKHRPLVPFRKMIAQNIASAFRVWRFCCNSRHATTAVLDKERLCCSRLSARPLLHKCASNQRLPVLPLIPQQRDWFVQRTAPGF